MAVLATLLLLPTFAQAQQHDCRIRRISAGISNPGDGLIHIRALYRSADGAILTPATCPDQNGPTWGGEAAPSSFSDPFGYFATFDPEALGQGVHLFAILTKQGINSANTHGIALYFCLKVTGDVGHAVTCPASPSMPLVLTAASTRKLQ